MSILFGRAQSRGLGDTPSQIVPNRVASTFAGTVNVTADSALRMSAMWAALVLRANLVSSTPLDVFKRSRGIQEEMPKPALISNPGGSGCTLPEWLYSSQFDLDRYGNQMGWIGSRDGLGFARQVELWETGAVTVKTKGRRITGYRYDGSEYAPDQVWHEKQYTVSGMPVGLSPIAYAAWSLGGYLSAQQFALNWFGNGAFPSGVLKNTAESELDPAVIEGVRRRFKAATANNEIFVTGDDWEYTMATVDSQTTGFLEEMKYGIADIARFMGVPGDLIGAETSTGSITYANVSQRMLQFLINQIGGIYTRREAYFSAQIPSRQYVKFNADAILRMDPETRTKILNGQVLSRTRAPSEARALDNYEPYTPEQVAEFDMLNVPLAKPKTVGASE